MKNIGLQGLNYRNTSVQLNGELHLIKVIADFYSSYSTPLILFDVGANVGNYSKLLLTNFPDNSTIYAFEPFSIPFQKLTELQRNHSSLKIHQAGFSDKEEYRLVFSSEEYSEIGGMYNRDYLFKETPHEIEETSRFLTLDGFCAENKINHIQFIKIDVEGHELFVLKGAANLLQTHKIDIIQFEFGAGNHFSRTCFMDFYVLLDRSGYSMYRLLCNGLEKIARYSADYEMMIVTNFVAIKKDLSNDFFARKNE